MEILEEHIVQREYDGRWEKIVRIIDIVILIGIVILIAVPFMVKK